ncbi:unnamed protein product, partial [Ixodes persulcatus]
MKGDRGSEQQPPPLRQQQRPAVPSHGRLLGADVGRTGSSCSDRYDDDNVVAASPIASYLGAGHLSGMMEAALAQQQQYAGLSLSQLNYNNNNGLGQRVLRRDTPPSQTSSCTDSVLLQDPGDELQWCADYPFNREFQRHLCSSSMSSSGRLLRRSILEVAGGAAGDLGVDEGGLGGVDLSYEDLSKNFDANLAEIDMETFRSEDIHAILTLPALYGGDFQSASRGEQCASVSGSFLEALPLDASSSLANGDDSNEMSICRDEPLFSPVKECHPVGQGGRPGGAGGALSTDSLDCSSLEDHDLVLTCQANKDNYTIAFQQSGTHFSDDLSDGSRSEQQPSQMARSELSFTTWHRLRSSGVRLQPSDGGKSQSLPNLLRRSAAVAGRGGDGCLPLYSLQASTHGSVGSGDARSVSLLRLFMQSKTGSGGSLSSSRSENSDSETSPRDAATAYHLQSSTEESSGSMDSKSDVGERFLKCKPRVKQIVAEANNNNNNNNSSSDEDTSATTRANDNERLRMLTSESEEETSTSQYFEDSLVEAAQLRTKPQTNARSPIREEEEPFESSGDETMKDSRDLLASSDGGASSEGGGGVVERRNNDVNSPLRRNAKSSGQLLEDGRNARSSSLTSSGYVSRQNSVDQIHRQTFLLSAGGNRRKPPLTAIAGVRHSSTQVPVHIRDRGIQTSVEGAVSESSNWLYTVDDSSAAALPGQRSFNATLQAQRESAGSDGEPKRSIYVCYPNYSLPDLSFLKELAQAEDKPELVLRPTQHRLPCPPDEAAATVAPAAFACVDTAAAPPPVPHRRTHSSEPHWRRPKSCTDFEDLSRRNLSHIQDWDSLSVLLPDDVKAMVSRFRNAAPPNPAPMESQQRGILRKLPDEPRRPRSQCDGTPGATGSLEVPNRRHSLQDYRRLLKGLPDLDGLLPPCGNLVCSGSWRRNGGRGTRHATAGGTCVSCRAKKAVSFSEDLNVRTSDARAVRGTPYGCSACRSLAGSLERPNRNMTLLFGGSQEDQHPPHEFGVSPKGLSPSWGLSPLSRSQRELVEQKRGLLDGMLRSAKQVVDCYVTEKESQPYVGAPEPCLTEQSACGRLATECLVPTLRELLSDGLLPHVRGVFGRLPNSLWHLAHSLSQTKEGRKEMQELVEYIGQTDNFCADGEKFSACLLGLLNLGCLDTWFLTLLSSPQILQKHYQTSAAFVALLSHPSLFFLREELACSLRSLSELPFSFSLSFALAAEAQSLKRHPAAPFPACSPCACPPATNYGESPGEDSDDLRTATCQSLVDSSSLEETLDNSSRVLELQRKLKGGASPMDGAKVLYPAMQKTTCYARGSCPVFLALTPAHPSVPFQMHRAGHQPSGGVTKKGASAAEGNRRQLRPRTPDSRTPSPNLPQGGACPPSSNRQAPQTRRSLIPVHRGWRKG